MSSQPPPDPAGRVTGVPAWRVGGCDGTPATAILDGMTEWLTAVVVALTVCGLAVTAVGLIAYICLVDRFRVDVASWIGDLTQGVIVLVATLALLTLAVVSDEPYAYVAAAATAGAEAVGVWLLWLISRLREGPARTTAFANSQPLGSPDGSSAGPRLSSNELST
jgi:hypothetical protein